MKYVFQVGKKERHKVEVSTEWSGLIKIIVRVDGGEKAKKFLWGFTPDLIIPIGEEEKHELMVCPRYFARLKVYVDGKPFPTGVERVYKIEGEKEWRWLAILFFWPLLFVIVVGVLLAIFF